ncbi:uncharacterized protein [Neodiprion pinetum]|uniref:Uncharacterized protein LOC107223459 isoform X2 n=1 Tax=Neodiprion lecontei TaxID=441921 RepID=A0ABM3GJH3_NEOLC|nr:uncharacterized protein LOC124174467 isoform X3 [Neodiprion fabricii]XP_046489448.1 uncharacterized protein LOC124222475 isoform X2 [Neodiprion pinetum]XP_046600424.1 uncharacterized protein LOC107223459 isoform X2 [Neodiprion lecontei]XP_046603066.1 uncharacterized protein LOC124296767 [Neodiprion virginianus]
MGLILGKTSPGSTTAGKMNSKMMMMLVGGYSVQGASVLGIIHDLLQDNVAGRPVIHEKSDWDFDPDVGKLRRVQFEAINGPQGRDLIDRLGYGIGAHGVTPKTTVVKQPAVILANWDASTPGSY